MKPVEPPVRVQKVRFAIVVPGAELHGVDAYQEYCKVRRDVYVDELKWLTADQLQDGKDENAVFVVVIVHQLEEQLVDGEVADRLVVRVAGGMRIIPPSLVPHDVLNYVQGDVDVSMSYELSRLAIAKRFRGRYYTEGIFAKAYDYLMRVGANAVSAAAVEETMNSVRRGGYPVVIIGRAKWGPKQKELTTILIPLTGLIGHLWRTNKKTWLQYLAMKYGIKLLMLYMRLRGDDG